MNLSCLQGANSLFGRVKKTKFDYGLYRNLPTEYHKFLKEYNQPKEPVHYIPEEGVYRRNEKTGEVKPIQNVLIPLTLPPESHQGIWGGEAVIKGFSKKIETARRVPKWWVPVLFKEVVRSDLLNKFMHLQVTQRAIELINKHQGFDNYILETKANDLQSYLALRIKREILIAIKNGLPDLADQPEKQHKLLDKYRHFGEQVSDGIFSEQRIQIFNISNTFQYTFEELEWYGLSEEEALKKVTECLHAEKLARIKPMKHALRAQLIEDLKATGEEKIEALVREEDGSLLDPYNK